MPRPRLLYLRPFTIIFFSLVTIALKQGFKFGEASSDDIPEIFAVLCRAFARDEVWEYIVKDCKDEDILPWVLRELAPRWAMPDIKAYQFTEEASG